MGDYEHTGNAESIDASVTRHHEGVDATPDGHAREAERIFGLASAVLTLHERAEDAEVLDEAIAQFRAAVGATIPDQLYARAADGGAGPAAGR
jgi:hypothetical protein